jgi:hypothetical protein
VLHTEEDPEPWEVFADAVLAYHAGDGRHRLGAAPGLAAAQEVLQRSLEEPSLFTAVALMARLDQRDVNVFSLLLGVEVDQARQQLVATLHQDSAGTRLTLGLLAALLPPDGHLGVSADSALARAGLVVVERDGPWAARTVGVPGSVVWNFAGDRSFDPDLPDRFQLIASGRPPERAGQLLLVNGGDRATRAQRALDRFGGVVLVTAAPQTVPEWDAVVRTATVGMMGVVLDVHEELSALAARYLSRATHLSWAVSSTSELPLECLPERTWSELAIEDGQATEEEWEALVGAAPLPGARLTREQLRLAASAASGREDGMVGAVRRLAGGHLDRLTTRIRPRRTWADLVLPPAQLAQVQELVTRYRHRQTVYGTWGFHPTPSTGVVALFSGPSGTGKTLTAEIIAGELGLDLFKLDLSSVVSKYIGETEKNLEALFMAAETGDAVLFFDEADALLGKRSEVNDSHDRYANLEVAYLLQRLERHDGLVLMATNLAKNIDAAFLRRIHVSVEFPVPDAAERREIWARSFPDGCPCEDLDFGWLAKQFNLTGGAIRNTATAAAFLAAHAGSSVTMERVLQALRRELQKLGRLVHEEEFSDYEPAAGPTPLGPSLADPPPGPERRRRVAAAPPG